MTAARRGGERDVAERVRALSGFDGWSFDPAALVRAVNALASPGEDAVAVLRSIARDEHGREGALLAARALYVAPRGETPPALEIGRPEPGPPARPGDFPLFPLHVEGDLPLLLVAGYVMGGEWSPGPYLDWCERAGEPRAGRLVPRADPLAAADAVVASPAWERLGAIPEHAAMVRMQALRALGDAYGVVRPALDDGRGERWARHRRALAGAPVEWDAAGERYVRAEAPP